MPFVTSRINRPPARNIQPRNDPHRMIADATVPHLALLIATAIHRLRRELTDRVVVNGVIRGDMGKAIEPALLDFQRELRGTKLFLANAHMQATTLQSHKLRGIIRKASVEFDLDNLPQTTQDALDDYDFGLIREITDDVRSVIADVVQRGIQEGLAPDKIARNIRGSIGLTATQEQAVENYRSMLENADAGALDRQLRDARFDNTVEEAINTSTPLSDAQINRLVERYEDRYIAYRANTIARYETLRASNQGGLDAVQSAVDDGTLDPDTVTKHWLIADDEITCKRCRSIIELQPDGVPINEPFLWQTTPSSKRGIPQSGEIDIAPLHPDCVVGLTKVSAIGGISAVAKRWYDGDLVILSTTKGEQLSCTPNHPILTPGGWVRARLLNEGSRVFGRIVKNGISGQRGYDKNVPSLIEQIAEAARCSEQMAPMPMPMSAEDFHGDGIGSDVAVIWANSFLKGQIFYTAPSEQIGELTLCRADMTLSDFTALRPPAFGRERNFSSTSGAMGGTELATLLLFGHAFPFEKFSGTSPAEFNARAVQMAQQSGTRYPEAFAQFCWGLSREIALDRVVKIEIRKWAGHVFNLETESGMYFGSDILTHNCRCTNNYEISGVETEEAT